MNVDYGPWDGSAFFNKAQEACQKLMQSGGTQHPLARCFWEAILKDVGLWEVRFDEGIEEQVQEKLAG